MKKITYGLYRIGANSANQGMTDRMLVAVVEAANRAEAEACEAPKKLDVHASAWAKLAPEVTVWANQRLEAVPVSRISRAEMTEYEERAALDRENAKYA